MQNNHLLKKAILALLLCVAMPILNAQIAHVGDILCEGDLIVSPANYPSSGATAKAVVFYVDNTGQHGWAIALEDAGSYSWGDYPDTPLPNYGSKRQAVYDLDGYENTRIVRDHSTNHPAFYAVDFENGWYVPTIGQLNYLYGSLNEVNNSLMTIGGSPFAGEWRYWTSTENGYKYAWYLSSSGDVLTYQGLYYDGYKNESYRVRAAINF